MNNMNVIYKFDDSVTSDLFSIEPFVKGAVSELEGFIDDRDATVSYTHLDVYKRQFLYLSGT